MSVVTNIIVSGILAPNECKIVQNELNKFTGKTMPFLQIDGSKVGGSKALECQLFIASINFIDADRFIQVFEVLKKSIDSFEDLQVFILNEDDVKWKIYLASELNLKCFGK